MFEECSYIYGVHKTIIKQQIVESIFELSFVFNKKKNDLQTEEINWKCHDEAKHNDW